MKKNLIILSIILLALPSVSAAEQRAVMSFSGGGSSYAVGQQIPISVMVNPNGQVFDTAKAIIKFPADLLSVKSVTLSQDFSVADPESFHNNTTGMVSYAGGIPGGSSTISTFISIIFTVKKEGSVQVSFDSSSVVLNGGENILKGFGSPLAIQVSSLPIVQPGQEKLTEEQKPSTKTTQTAPKDKYSGDVKNSTGAALEETLIPIENQESKTHLAWFALGIMAAVVLLFYFRKKVAFFWQGIFKPVKNNEIQ